MMMIVDSRGISVKNHVRRDIGMKASIESISLKPDICRRSLFSDYGTEKSIGHLVTLVALNLSA